MLLNNVNMHLLTYLLSLSVSLDSFSLNNTLSNSSTEIDDLSRDDSPVSFQNLNMYVKESPPSKSPHLERRQKDSRIPSKKYGRLRKLQDSGLERDRNRTRMQKELVNSTILRSSENTKDDKIASQSTVHEPKHKQHNLSYEIFKDQNRPQRNRSFSELRNIKSTVSTSSTKIAASIRHPAAVPTTQTTKSPFSIETTAKQIIKKVSSEGRFKNRPQRNHKRKHNARQHHKTRFTSRPKSTDKLLASHVKQTSLKRVKQTDPSLPSPHGSTKKTGTEAKSKLSNNGGAASSKDCPTCGSNNNISEEKIREIRLKKFISTMADKLRSSPNELMARHKKRFAPRFPRELFEETLQDNAMRVRSSGFFAKDQKVIISGKDLGRNCIAKRTSGCYTFDLASKIKGDVASAELWVYKTPDRNDTMVQTMMLYGLERMRSGRVAARNQLQRHDTYVREGWVVINVTRTVTSWVQKRKSQEMIAIRCATCVTRNHKALYGTKHGYKPLIIIKYDRTSIQTIERRSYDDCDPRSGCCKRRLDINFRDIHMHSVQAPPDLSVGYCYGHCDDVHQYTHNHTMMKQRVRYVDEGTSDDLRFRLKPCCVPIVLKPTSIMIYSEGILTQTLMPNVIVEKCGCV